MAELNVPLVGNAWLVGIFGLLHFALVSIAGLSPLVIFLAEGTGLRRGEARLLRMGKEYLTLVLEIAVLGGILGSGLVVALIGLHAQVISLIVNVFFWPLLAQLVCYIGGLAAGFAYYFSWGANGRGHRIYGLLAAVLPLVPFVVFSAAAAFINQPGSWPESGALLAAIFNPLTIPSLLQRAAAGLALQGCLLVALHLRKVHSPEASEADYHGFAVRWAGKLILAGTAAFVVLSLVRPLWILPEARQLVWGGTLTVPWLLSVVLAGLVAGLLLRQARADAARQGWPTWVVVMVLTLASVWLMGTTRALERGDFAIAGVLDRQGRLVAAPSAYGTAGGAVTGEQLFQRHCSACHPGLAGDAVAKARQRHPDPLDLATFLRNPATANIAMPPVLLDEPELRSLVAYLLGIPLEQVPALPAAGEP